MILRWKWADLVTAFTWAYIEGGIQEHQDLGLAEEQIEKTSIVRTTSPNILSRVWQATQLCSVIPQLSFKKSRISRILFPVGTFFSASLNGLQWSPTLPIQNQPELRGERERFSNKRNYFSTRKTVSEFQVIDVKTVEMFPLDCSQDIPRRCLPILWARHLLSLHAIVIQGSIGCLLAVAPHCSKWWPSGIKPASLQGTTLAATVGREQMARYL